MTKSRIARALLRMALQAGLLIGLPAAVSAAQVSPPAASGPANTAADLDAGQAFASAMIARLAAAHPEATFRPHDGDPLVLEVNAGQWNGTQLFLHRIFAFCQTASPAECEAGKARFAANVLGQRPAPQRENLRVIVRGAEYIEFALARASKERQPWFFVRKIGDDLYEALALDGPRAIGLVSAADLAAMKLKPGEAWALARTQTRARLPALPDPATLLSEAVTFESGEYMGSVLADTAGWQAIRNAIGPDLFVTVTSDQFVMASLLGEGPALDEFAKAVAQDCKAAQRCISPHIYRFEGGMWVIEK